ncbi:MAG: hypothetical protein GY790_00445, partial [Bacteroidetes bacterium]|nr:hypothetical protein [Bacteroidota bacterium]
MSQISRFTSFLMGLLALLAWSATAFSQAVVTEFEHLTLEDGLPNLRVEAIEQDYLGYMWIGSKRGLCRYNGYDFEVYKSSAFDTTSLRYHQITCLFEDREHELWIGTWSGGLHRYNRDRDNIQRIPFSQDNITGISQDSTGYIWIGTEEGLYRYDKQNEHARAYPFQSPDRTIVRGVLNIVQNSGETFVNIDQVGIFKFHAQKDDFIPVLLLEDCKSHGIREITEVVPYNNHTYWLGTDQGLFRFSTGKEGSLERILDKNQVGIHQNITFIINESYNHIWIGANGLYRYDIVENTISHFQHNRNEDYSLSNDYVTCGYTDIHGNIWFGTYASGINIIMNSSADFHKNSAINQKLDLLSRNVTAIEEDRDKNLWIGTWDKGVIVFNEQQEQIENIGKIYPALESLPEYNVSTIFKGPADCIWIGSSSGILAQIDIINRQNHLFTLPVPNGILPRSMDITSLIAESDSLLWIGSASGGIFLLNLHTKDFIQFEDQKLMVDKNIRDIELDGEGNIWIGTYGHGLFRMDSNRKIKPHIFKEIVDPGTRPLSIITIFLDQHENLWFGTEFHGLIKLSPEDQTTIFPISGDLNNNEITSILEDRMGKLWLATSDGLLRFEESTSKVSYYYWRDGLVADEFNYSASFQNENDVIYLGGTNGLVYFHPGSIQDNYHVPPVYIESFSIGNREVHVSDPDSPLTQPINQTEKITLKFSQNEIGFEFVALNYLLPGKNQYKYLLEGFDESGWNELGTRRRISFTNLDYGNYTLRVLGSNNDEVWNEEGATLDIRILPPPWRMWWAYLAYSILMIVAVYLVYTDLRQRIRLRQQISRQRYEREHQEELSNMKLQFFTNISHEFKIPLSLIISPLEEIVRNFKGSTENRQKLQGVQRNSIKLLRLIKLLIDFRKAEQDVLKLAPGRHDLVDLAQEAVQSFESLVIEQNKRIELKSDFSSCLFDFDWNKMDRVFYNLISNALNFTEELSEIIIHVASGDKAETISIAVQDTGVGINE